MFCEVGQAGVGDLAAAQVEQPQLFGLGQVGEARIGDIRVEQREVA